MAKTSQQEARTETTTSTVSNQDVTESLNAYIGKGVTFTGNITYTGNVRIDGRMKGEIRIGGCLLIAEGAEVTATISAGSIVSLGTMTGDITATEKVELRPPAILNGTLVTPVMSMEKGVVLNGMVTMTHNQALESLEHAGHSPRREPAYGQLSMR